MKKNRSFFWQLAIPFFIIVVVALSGLTLYLTAIQQKSIITETHNDLLRAANLFNVEAQDKLSDGLTLPMLSNGIYQNASIVDARVTLIARDGTVVADSESDAASMENHLNRPEVQESITQGTGAAIRFSETLKKNFYYLSVPITKGQETIGFIRYARSLSEIEDQIRTMRWSLIGVSILIGLAMVAFAAYFAKRSAAPLAELTDKIEALNFTGEPIDVSLDSRDEVGRLSLAFTKVANQLNDQILKSQGEQALMEAVLNHMKDAVVYVDHSGKVILFNPAAESMFSTAAKDALGRTLAEVVRQHQFVDLWRSAVESSEQKITVTETTPERLFIQAIATPMNQSDPDSALMVFQDLTQVRRLENVRRDFVSNVSHELRTPLTSLKALSETLQDGALDDPASAEKFLKQMDNEIDNLTQMVNELLQLSRLESGKIPFQRQASDPVAIVENATERMRLQAERGQLNLEVATEPNLPMVHADADRIEAVLINLIHNAIKFTKPGGYIRVNARRQQGMVVFSVQDTGVGITREELSRIFERFYKIDQSRSDSGTGLGLSIARHTVEAHQGRIWVESEVGKGSTFSFTVPTT